MMAQFTGVWFDETSRFHPPVCHTINFFFCLLEMLVVLAAQQMCLLSLIKQCMDHTPVYYYYVHARKYRAFYLQIK
jgi:hypothetical protein